MKNSPVGTMSAALSPSTNPVITYRSDLSTLYKALRTTARPMRSHIIKVKGEYPASSPRLEKHP